MEIILHVGMGKTGSSSIQRALAQSASLLQAQRASYLGMWFDQIDQRYTGIKGQQDFFSLPAEDMREGATRLVGILRNAERERGVSKFILSNEGLFNAVRQLSPFLEALKSNIDTRIIVYARDPREWLPSAYIQWAVVHKFHPGPIRSYGEMARELIQHYSLFPVWFDKFGDIFMARPFLKTTDVVQDFSEATGLELQHSSQRVLERVDAGEGLLRAIYNNRLEEASLPDRFDTAFRGAALEISPRLDQMVNIFDYRETDEIVSENLEMFKYLRNKAGINLLESPPPGHERADMEDLRHRVLDHVLHIIMSQADRISSLENEIAELKSALLLGERTLGGTHGTG